MTVEKCDSSDERNQVEYIVVEYMGRTRRGADNTYVPVGTYRICTYGTDT